MIKNARLFEQFKPEYYDLSLTVNGESKTFSGKVTIEGQKIGRPSQRITLHQKDLKITSAKVIRHDKKGDQPVELVRINLQKSFDEVRLHSQQMLYPGKYTIELEFSGRGYLALKDLVLPGVKIAPRAQRFMVDDFVPHFARQVFPSIDEPLARAKLDVTVGEFKNRNQLPIQSVSV